MVDYLIESNKLGPEENEIIRIAWETVARRREEAKKRGTQQLKLNGAERENGYTIYRDYNEYMEKRKQQEQLDPNWGLGRVRYEIRNTLLSKGWAASQRHPETRFYPPRLG